jgi:small subunit ribosomal protein S27e
MIMASGFVKAKCAKCKNEQMIFGKPATEVKCLVCGEVLARPGGGRGIMAAPKAEENAAAEKTKPAAAVAPKTEAAPAKKKAKSDSE